MQARQIMVYGQSPIKSEPAECNTVTKCSDCRLSGAKCERTADVPRQYTILCSVQWQKTAAHMVKQFMEGHRCQNRFWKGLGVSEQCWTENKKRHTCNPGRNAAHCTGRVTAICRVLSADGTAVRPTTRPHKTRPVARAQDDMIDTAMLAALCYSPHKTPKEGLCLRHDVSGHGWERAHNPQTSLGQSASSTAHSIHHIVDCGCLQPTSKQKTRAVYVWVGEHIASIRLDPGTPKKKGGGSVCQVRQPSHFKHNVACGPNRCRPQSSRLGQGRAGAHVAGIRLDSRPLGVGHDAPGAAAIALHPLVGGRLRRFAPRSVGPRSVAPRRGPHRRLRSWSDAVHGLGAALFAVFFAVPLRHTADS